MIVNRFMLIDRIKELTAARDRDIEYIEMIYITGQVAEAMHG